MGQIAKWGDLTFLVTANVIHSFTNFTIKNSCNTETKNCQGQDYLTKKSIKPAEVSFNVPLNAFTGCNVEQSAKNYLYAARAGRCHYIYIGGTKLLPFQFRLTETSISDLVLSPTGKWISCTVKLTMKQGTQDDSSVTTGGGSSGGGSSGGGSSSPPKKTTAKKPTTKKTSAVSVVGAVVGAVVAAVSTVKKVVSVVSTVSNAIKTAAAVVNKAKTVSKPAAPKPVVKPARVQNTKIKRMAK
ncbi:MAG: hypothetical protein PHI27_06500 [Eubacteriales bacterium]|nr:hypothetical protein [Eubacteriales bacterium]MDD4512869.1 hypothetical protein [Eubacteriales bacterium]